MTTTTKKTLSKRPEKKIGGNDDWTIVYGALTRPRGNPGKARSLFKAVGEKIPFAFLSEVEETLKEEKISLNGVYIAHDSMGYPRYVGRGQIFSRLKARRDAQVLELVYFSFFVVENKMHEREVETIMIRAAGPLLDFNDRKVRRDIEAGDVRDFEPGTKYIERQYRKGRRAETDD